MIQEEIEKAANQITFIETTDERERFLLRSGFKAGAKWRVDASWHEVTESPKPNKWIFLLREDGTIKQIYTYDGVSKLFNDLIGYKWAYVEDLMP